MNESIRENFKPTIFVVIVLLLLAVSAYPQYRMGGKVMEVLDGKTIVIELFSSGKITAELQHVEVPEAEQQLHQEAIDHLRKLVLGKTVDFRPLRMIKARTVGQILLNGTDVSQQMIRDGAAWYAAEKTGQEQAEITLYQSTENQAKTEKRGVWSIEGLKPAWQVRAEAEANRKLQEKIALESAAKMSLVGKVKMPRAKIVSQKLTSESQMFATAEPGIKLPENITNVGGLLVGYNNAAKLGIVMTPPLRLNYNESDGTPAVGIQIAYIYYDGDQNRGRQNVYLVGVESQSRDFKFLSKNNLVITADGKKINAGKAKRTERKDEFGVKESLVYKIDKSVIEKVANGKNVSVRVGAYSWKLDGGTQMLLGNLLQLAP